MLLLRSLLFTGLMFASVVPWSFVVLAGRLGGEHRAYRLAQAWCAGIAGLARLLCGLEFRVEGAGNLPRDRAAVVLLKHSSAYETLVQLLLFPRQCWVLKRELTWIPLFGWALAMLRPIAINRGGGRRAVDQVLEQGRARLDEGTWVMIFPEGTRMPPGQTRRYGLSGALLAQRCNSLLIPVAHNAGDFWPRRGLRKRAGTVTFRIGAPVDPAGRDPREVNEEIQAWIEGQVAELRATGAPATGDQLANPPAS
ncbi:MAG: 1-acyl-sn-glycerol-3-phosphate acyltransferase [Chromatiales bacterium]|nr:1-acyl-sn-glycerol-3-phosphate acyltransferase [Chromatiales bacterium]